MGWCMMNKILSISVAAYNVEDVIEKCLDSFVNSKYLDDIEILVINDGSKDSTEKIVNRYHQMYPQSIFLVNKENGGHGSTINKSICLACGKYFKIVDGDDWVDSDEFDGFIEELFICEADLMINDYNKVYTDRISRVNVIGSYSLNNVSDIKQMDLSKIFPMHSITVRTEKLRQNSFRMSSNRFYADTEYVFFVLSVVKKFQVSEKCIYQYRLGVEGQSVSSSGLYRHIEDMLYIEGRLIDEYMNYENHSNGDIIEKFLSDKYILIFHWFVMMERGDKIGKLKEFDETIRKKYPYFIKNINFGKYGLVKYNYSFFISLYRMLHKLRLLLNKLV